MARIRSFNLDRWSEPDEQRRVRHIGMADARETFEKLKKHLEATACCRMSISCLTESTKPSLRENSRTSIMPSASPIMEPARAFIWTSAWCAGMRMAAANLSHLPPARLWKKAGTLSCGCTGSQGNARSC